MEYTETYNLSLDYQCTRDVTFNRQSAANGGLPAAAGRGDIRGMRTLRVRYLSPGMGNKVQLGTWTCSECTLIPSVAQSYDVIEE